jgi:hypothetical protein
MLILTLAIIVILSAILFRVLPIRARRILLVSLSVVSILINVIALGYYLAEHSPIGGGQQAESPNHLYMAWAESLRPPLRSQSTYYLLTIQSRTDRSVLKSVRVDFNEKDEPLDFRELPEIIHWSKDSSQVTFDFHDVHVRIKDLMPEKRE